MGTDPISYGQDLAMRHDPFLDFQLTAERAGFPALLIVSAVCLALVVVPVALLALTEASWVLALALLSLVGAIASLTAGVGAAFADRDKPDLEPPKAVAGPDERENVVPGASKSGARASTRAPAPADEDDRKAA